MESFGFTGREHELEAGLVYLRQRYAAPAQGVFGMLDPLTPQAARSGALQAEAGLRGMFAGIPAPPTDARSRYAYAAHDPTNGTDPTGLFVLYTGISATVAFPGLPGGTGSLGGVFGYSSQQGLSTAVAVTFGFAIQLNRQLNIAVGAEFGTYWGLETACDYAGPFVTLGVDLGAFGLNLVWSLDDRYMSSPDMNLLAALGKPVGLAAFFPIPIGRLLAPITLGNSGMTAYITGSELHGIWGCIPLACGR